MVYEAVWLYLLYVRAVWVYLVVPCVTRGRRQAALEPRQGRRAASAPVKP